MATTSLAGLGIGYLWFAPDIEVDACLDRGGIYDDDANRCVTEIPIDFQAIGTELDCSKPETLKEVPRLLCQMQKDAAPSPLQPE